jgi:hypothetical protein
MSRKWYLVKPGEYERVGPVDDETFLTIADNMLNISDDCAIMVLCRASDWFGPNSLEKNDIGLDLNRIYISSAVSSKEIKSKRHSFSAVFIEEKKVHLLDEICQASRMNRACILEDEMPKEVVLNPDAAGVRDALISIIESYEKVDRVYSPESKKQESFNNKLLTLLKGEAP